MNFKPRCSKSTGGFAEYDDDIVRYLIESIRVTDDLKLIINVKGGASVTEELYQRED